MALLHHIWIGGAIYYLSNNENIITGIEENRYPYLKELTINSLRYDQIENKKVNIAVFYLATKYSVNYRDLYDCFMSVCNEIGIEIKKFVNDDDKPRNVYWMV